MNADPQFRKGRKFDQVVAGARDVFMREGYEGASVDVIARDAGVSKATLYSYFPDKQALFMAVLGQECDLHICASADDCLGQMELPEALHRIASTFLTFILSEDGMKFFRICAAESVRFPELGQAFYQAGPRKELDELVEFLTSDHASAYLDIDDAHQAADTLMQLCRTDLLLQRMMGVIPVPSAEMIDVQAQNAVRTFMARYGR